MNVLIGWCGELRENVDTAGEEILARVDETGKHVIDLTKTVRDFVEALENSGDPRIEPTDIGALIDGEVAKRRSIYPEATFNVDDDLPAITVAANELLSSVFRNILNNAVQHNGKKNPSVDIEVEAGDEDVTVRIADDGPGIPDEQKGAIFGRGEMGLGDPSGGIGLYLVDMLVTSYGGDVWVEDNEPSGSVFVVRLPRNPTR